MSTLDELQKDTHEAFALLERDFPLTMQVLIVDSHAFYLQLVKLTVFLCKQNSCQLNKTHINISFDLK